MNSKNDQQKSWKIFDRIDKVRDRTNSTPLKDPIANISCVFLLELTSWWDVYETFAHLLRMAEEAKIVDPLAVQWKSTTSGISLFHPIPERNCSTAGIPGK